MVLVLAALYSLYRSNSDSSEESLVGKAKEAILRCASPPTNNDPPEVDMDDDDDDDMVLHRPRRLHPPVEFSPLVKGEWIDACFGREFLRPDPVSKNFRVQIIEIPAKVASSLKVGVTVSRLALGATVRAIAPGSAAAYAGIRVDSVLVSVDERPVVAEPTKTLLERLWQVEGPVLLTLCHQGSTYTVLLLHGTTGLQWAPAAPHLALVQRTAGAAAAAGLVRGSLLVAVNGRTFRELDHVQTALHVRDVYENHQALQLTVALPKTTILRGPRQYDGVEVKYVPMRYAIGSLCTPMAATLRERDDEDVAEAVAAGRREAPMEPPTVMRRSYEVTKFPQAQMIKAWDPLLALVYCLSFRHAGYNETNFPVFEPPEDPIGALHKHASGISHFLLQFLSLVCASTPHSNELTSMLLKASRKDAAFCQRLYFMLRSFIASLEVSNRDSRNLLALLNCLEMLRFAEKAITPSTETKQWLPRTEWKQDNPLDPTTYALPHSPSTIYDHASNFLSELDHICNHIEQVLPKSMRQRITDWALHSGKALDEVTTEMRKTLGDSTQSMLLVNPVKNDEVLCSIDPEQCYILPSAHFPILLTFHTSGEGSNKEQLYTTSVSAVSFTSHADNCVLHACLAGTAESSGASTPNNGEQVWGDSCLKFETQSAWGAPNTLSLRVSSNGHAVAFGWVDLSEQWHHGFNTTREVTVPMFSASRAADSFDEHGDMVVDGAELKLNICTQAGCTPARKRRLLLYKHDDDLRQEAFAVQFIQTCDDILKASGLDLKFRTFQHCPVGAKRGFVEWVPGSIPLSEICHHTGRVTSSTNSSPKRKSVLLSRLQSMGRIGGGGGGGESESLRAFVGGRAGARGSLAHNPIQEYLRSVAYDATAPYLIQRRVMDTYVKSCAGYSVVTYILGVGDRHLDNLLLHKTGSFFHCDYSFILGQDPKKFLPMRVTEDMVNGMGGKDSDNYAKFLSLTGASFLALRRPENVRVLLSMVRLLEGSCLPDISSNQTIEEAIMGVVERLKLDLLESEAIAYMEHLVETSVSSKIWLAVDAMHNLGKRF